MIDHTQPVLRLLQAADEVRSKLSGEFSAIHGLSVNEYLLLMHLDRAALNRLSRVELAKRMHVSASTVTRMARPLEKIGLLDKAPDARDARLSLVVLTDTGKNRLAEVNETFAKQSRYVFQDRWESTEVEDLSHLLYRLVVNSSANLT
ncbi:MAG: MarR family transcriptional regulator [Pseudomonadota bacterium]